MGAPPEGDTMSVIYSEVAADEPTTNSFWMPNHYQSTVKRLDDGYRVCDQIVACFQERAKIERNYALMMDEWTRKWQPLVDASPAYGSLLRAWQAFLGASERLSRLHMEMQRALVSEDAGRIRSWQHDSYHRKLFGGFKEACELENGFQRAQKPWTKKLKKTEKAKTLYHKACRKEHIATLRESGIQAASGTEISPDRQRALREEHQRCSQETIKIRERYEKALQELDRSSPRYMEEMESVFEQGQALEQRRIVFLKSAFLALHRRLDITADSSVQAVYSDLHQAIEEINDQEDLKWWRNRNGPGMPMNWPKFEDWSPDHERPQVKIKKTKEPEKVTPCSISPSQSWVQLPDGRLWRRHINQLRRRTADVTEPRPAPDPTVTVGPSAPVAIPPRPEIVLPPTPYDPEVGARPEINSPVASSNLPNTSPVSRQLVLVDKEQASPAAMTRPQLPRRSGQCRRRPAYLEDYECSVRVERGVKSPRL